VYLVQGEKLGRESLDPLQIGSLEKKIQWLKGGGGGEKDASDGGRLCDR